MWIVFVLSQKKFSIEVTGEETFHDIETILSEVYGFDPNISFFIGSTSISDKYYFTPIQEFPEIQNYTQIVIKEKGKNRHIIPPNVNQEKAIEIGKNNLEDDNNQQVYRSKSNISKRSQNTKKIESILEEKTKKKSINDQKDHNKSKRKSTSENKEAKNPKDKDTAEKEHKHHKHSNHDESSKHHKHRDTDGKHKHHKHSDTDGKHKKSDQNGHHKHHRHTKE